MWKRELAGVKVIGTIKSSSTLQNLVTVTWPNRMGATWPNQWEPCGTLWVTSWVPTNYNSVQVW